MFAGKAWSKAWLIAGHVRILCAAGVCLYGWLIFETLWVPGWEDDDCVVVDSREVNVGWSAGDAFGEFTDDDDGALRVGNWSTFNSSLLSLSKISTRVRSFLAILLVQVWGIWGLLQVACLRQASVILTLLAAALGSYTPTSYADIVRILVAARHTSASSIYMSRKPELQ